MRWVLFLALLVGSCGPSTPHLLPYQEQALEEARSHVGLTIKLWTYDTASICDHSCEAISGGQRLTVDGVGVNGLGHSLVHVTADNGVRGYIDSARFNVLRIHSQACGDYEPRIGMTTIVATGSSWCFPKDTNTTETVAGVLEQLVYPGLGYIYIRNGIVTAIQRTP